MQQSVVDLQDQLDQLGSDLLIGADSPAQLLPKLVEKYGYMRYLCGRKNASEELNLIKEFSKQFL
ncbi:hypothetical protein [Chryseobacterium indoltheticum]|uniref:hypothetical protein n=1 Tax=Chryseobacterium indoltheticum TaxID=254 RepID=UPI004040FA67